MTIKPRGQHITNETKRATYYKSKQENNTLQLKPRGQHITTQLHLQQNQNLRKSAD
jgi:hypothetical protein